MDTDRRDAQMQDLRTQCDMHRAQIDALSSRVAENTDSISIIRTNIDSLLGRMNQADQAHRQYDILLQRLDDRANAQDTKLKHIEDMIGNTNELITHLSSVFTQHSVEGINHVIGQSGRIEKLVKLHLILIGLAGSIMITFKLFDPTGNAFSDIIKAVTFLLQNL